MRPRPWVLGGQRMFPAYHSYRNICAQQLSAELLWKFTAFDCFQECPASPPAAGWSQAAHELLQDVRERSQFAGFGWNSAQGWGASLEPGAVDSVNGSFLPAFWFNQHLHPDQGSLNWRDNGSKPGRVGPQRVNNLMRNNQVKNNSNNMK